MGIIKMKSIQKWTLLWPFKYSKPQMAGINNEVLKRHNKYFFSSSICQCKEITEVNDSKLEKSKEPKMYAYLKKPFSPPIIPEKDRAIVEKLKTGEDFDSPNNARVLEILKEDIKADSRKAFHSLTNVKLGSFERKVFKRSADILVIGCGLMGLSTAFAFGLEFPNSYRVHVVDMNPNAPECSLNLSAGTISQLDFDNEVEIEMVKYSTDILSSISYRTMMAGHKMFRVPYESLGSLALANETNVEKIITNHKILLEHNIGTDLLSKETLKQKYPWMRVDDLELGCVATRNEGLIDPWIVAKAMKAKLINLGSTFQTAEVVDFGYKDGVPRYAVCRLPDGSYTSICFGLCVIAAGMGSYRLIDAINVRQDIPLKVRIPEEKRKRYEYAFYNPEGPGLDAPLLRNPDGVYFRREGLTGLYVAGIGDVGEEGRNGPYEIFDDKIKPFLTSRLTNFKEIELRSGWMDEYCTNFANEFGVIGFHPCHPQTSLAIGFTKRGWLHAIAAGKAIAEKLLYGSYRTIDMTDFEPGNLWKKEHMKAEAAKRKLLEKNLREALADS